MARVLREDEVIMVAKKTFLTISQMLPQNDSAHKWAESLGGMFAYALFEALYKAKAETEP